MTIWGRLGAIGMIAWRYGISMHSSLAKRAASAALHCRSQQS